MKKYNLFLDDVRNPWNCFSYTNQPAYLMNDWVVVRNYDEFVKMVTERGIPIVISFDHDLADAHYNVQEHVDEDYYDLCEERTGYHCAKWLLNYCLDNNLKPPTATLIHSMNGPGARNIESLFKTYYKVHGK